MTCPNSISFLKSGCFLKKAYVLISNFDIMLGLFNREWGQYGVNKITNTHYDVFGYDEDGYDRHGYDRDGYDKHGFNKKGFNRRGYYRDGYDRYGFNRNGINKYTGTLYNPKGFKKNRIHNETHGEFDQNDFNIDGYRKDGFLQFQLIDRFKKIIAEKNSELSRIIAIAYNQPEKMKTKLFFSHSDKIGIYSKDYEIFLNENVLHIEISRTDKQSGTSWIKPKDTGRKQGDNFESGYTLEIYFENIDVQLKKYLIENLSKIGFGSLPSEYSISCHYDEKYPNDQRALELLDKVVAIFNIEN